ncbi:MAG: radical SAM protein [Muribaculaceae bacterium]
MKKSIYNIFSDWKNIYCGVNLLSGSKIVLLQKDYEDYLNNFQGIEKTLYSALIEGGFIIKEDVDEYASLIHRRNQDVFFNNNTFQLTILPTLECNFKCWYCYEDHHESVMIPHVLERIKKYIDYIFENYPIFNFHLDWFGGEPLLYFNEVVKPISLYVKSICNKTNLSFTNTITTNGYLINDEMLSEFNDIRLNRFQITLDGDKDQHNKIRFEQRGKDSYTKIINNINKICQFVDDASVNVRINYTNKNIAGLGKIASDIHTENRDKIYISMQRVWQTRDIEDETKIEKQLNDEIECLQNNGIKVNYNNVLYRLGKRCYADTIKQSVVNYDGTLFKCTARNFADHKASVGHIDEDGVPVWNNNYYKHFLKPVFDNSNCKGCCYLPVCLGVCSQKFIEGGGGAISNECDPDGWAKSINEDLLQSLYQYIISTNKS